MFLSTHWKLFVVCSFKILQSLLIFENWFLSRLKFCQELDVIESRAVGEFVVDDVHFVRRRVEIQICDALTKLILSDVTMIVLVEVLEYRFSEYPSLVGLLLHVLHDVVEQFLLLT